MQSSSTNGSGKQQPRLPRLPSALPATLPTLPPTRPPCAWSWAWVARRGRSGWPASHPATPWASAEGQEAGSSRGGGAGWRQLDVSRKCMGGRRNAEGVLGKKFARSPNPHSITPHPPAGGSCPCQHNHHHLNRTSSTLASAQQPPKHKITTQPCPPAGGSCPCQHNHHHLNRTSSTLASAQQPPKHKITTQPCPPAGGSCPCPARSR